ncbi:hypothetical protein ONS95_011709 [Cadophora gregata]|uniref:uncharacterized protein n=1 Tax=Cadophora gregata TaxID=51156 RepID=UPI0026DBC31D|nr:uncharacterized protein ONS95_011709 [Cadophora gregata]KAK0120303.1 hypothetical protein ONS95_011709 [Cadophora gregata]KAK0121336.1 hypothetical protein ONS96_011511 [Cadophora gregata f. sp. sojae]
MASTAPNSPVSSDSISPSPTSTSRTTPPPSPRPTSASPTKAKDHLTTLPPELLLAVIYHLPSSSSLLPLSQTNTYLQTFLLTTHAATICNTFITTRHSHAASIFSATYRDGWFLPNHEAVLGTERRITRELVRKTGCGCVNCRAFLQSSRSTAASSSDLSLTSESSAQCCLKIPCFSSSPTRPAQSQASCKAVHLIDSPWKLSMPGPMFLVFLERYEWELETRYAMLEAECKDADAAKREEEERRFEFIVGNYSVRRFLEDVEREFEPAGREQETNSSEQPENSNRGLGRRLGGCIKKSWVKGRRMFVVKKKKQQNATQSRNSTPPLFGEIGRPESDTGTVQKHDRSWMMGLLWYYGLQTPSPHLQDSTQPQSIPSPSASTSQNHTTEKQTASPKTVAEASPPQSSSTAAGSSEKLAAAQASGNKTSRNCMAGVKTGMNHVSGKLKQVLRRCKYVGGFQSLQG